MPFLQNDIVHIKTYVSPSLSWRILCLCSGIRESYFSCHCPPTYHMKTSLENPRVTAQFMRQRWVNVHPRLWDCMFVWGEGLGTVFYSISCVPSVPCCISLPLPTSWTEGLRLKNGLSIAGLICHSLRSITNVFIYLTKLVWFYHHKYIFCTLYKTFYVLSFYFSSSMLAIPKNNEVSCS